MTRELLKLIAMITMVFDHTAMVGLAGDNWQLFGAIGRIAFPIFAFQVATGFLHTSSKKRYLLTMGLFALISEVPFNLVHGAPVYPFSQNVMFTFFIALAMLCLVEKWCPMPWSTAKDKVKGVLLSLVLVGLGNVLGFVGFVDYYGMGVMFVMACYFALRLPMGRCTLFGRIVLMTAALIYMCDTIGGMHIIWNGMEVQIQMMAVIAMVPIALYLAQGEKKALEGTSAKVFKYVGYAFYPAHLLVLYLIASATY